MQLHTIRPRHRTRERRRVGRGGKRGTYSGKGMKGQKSRSGAKIRPEIRDLIKKIPKLRGMGFAKPQKAKPEIVNIEQLAAYFQSGAQVTPKTLVAAGMLRTTRGRLPRVKLLGSGTLTKKLLVAGCEVSGSAKRKIEKAGGTIS